MPVPQEIRSVNRPKNTIVEDRGRDGPKRYAVRERGIIKCIPGKNPQPHNGKVIGHIINGKFVPLVKSQNSESTGIPDMLSYGSSALIKSVSEDLLEDLLKVYDPVKAYTIITIASLKVLRPGITASRISTHYNRTYISVYYPGASISQNSIGALYNEIGADGCKRKSFYQLRMQSVSAKHHIAIDGTLKQNTSTVNDLSAYSYKAKIKGIKDISVVYAYDIDRMEPICAEVFPGNCIDASSYASFIRDNDVQITPSDQKITLEGEISSITYKYTGKNYSPAIALHWTYYKIIIAISNFSLKGNSLCDRVTNPCISGYYCIGGVCKKCHPSCYDCVNGGLSTDCYSKCSSHSALMTPNKGTCNIGYVDLNQFEDFDQS